MQKFLGLSFLTATILISGSVTAEIVTEEIPEIVQKHTNFKPLISPELTQATSPVNRFASRGLFSAKHSRSFDVTNETVGDADSFGRHAVWAGLGQTNIRFSNDCSIFPDETVCLPTSDDGSFQSFDEVNLERIVLPPKTAYSLLCHSLTPLVNASFVNNTGATAQSQFFFTPYVTITNATLDDPALINPNTGLPFNGVYEGGFSASQLDSRSLDAGEFEQFFRSTTRSCISGFMSRRLLGFLGLPDDVIDDFFKNETTLDFNMRGSHSLLSSGSITMGIRVLTDEYKGKKNNTGDDDDDDSDDDD